MTHAVTLKAFDIFSSIRLSIADATLDSYYIFCLFKSKHILLSEYVPSRLHSKVNKYVNPSDSCRYLTKQAFDSKLCVGADSLKTGSGARVTILIGIVEILIRNNSLYAVILMKISCLCNVNESYRRAYNTPRILEIFN